MMTSFRFLFAVTCVVSLRISPEPSIPRSEPPIPSVQAMLSSVCGPKCASVIAGDTELVRLDSEPVSALGGAPLCETEFVRKSFTEEDLIQTEKNVVQWLLDLDTKIEKYNNQDHVKKGTLAGHGKGTHPSEDHSPHQRFEVVLPVEGPRCKQKLTLFGKTHDTQKPICDVDGRLTKQEDCHMMSIGSNDQWDTEVGIHDQTRCKTHTFDCSSHDSRPEKIKDRATFHKICVGPTDKTDSKGQQFLTWHSALKAAGLTEAPEYLKMDIEGFEYDVMKNLIHTNHTELPNQIAMEIHHQTWQPWQNNPSSSLSWSDRNKDVGELLSFFLMMYTSGYRLSEVDHKTVCQHCLEVLWSKIYC